MFGKASVTNNLDDNSFKGKQVVPKEFRFRWGDFGRTGRKIREGLESSEALFIGAGAGIGVDSGLPDFRGTEGFWRAYPPLRVGYSVRRNGKPRWFHDNPSLAWGFYGHRYQNTKKRYLMRVFPFLKNGQIQ